MSAVSYFGWPSVCTPAEASDPVCWAYFTAFDVVVPVDGMSSVEAYADYGTVLTPMSAPQVAPKTTLTRSSMVKFQ